MRRRSSWSHRCESEQRRVTDPEVRNASVEWVAIFVPAILGVLLLGGGTFVTADEPEGVAKGGPTTRLSLPPRPGNPRNSEGAFLRLKDGRILFVYTHFTGGGGDHSAAHLAGAFFRRRRQDLDGPRTRSSCPTRPG